MTVAEMLARISSEELTEWYAYELRNGPLGPQRGDWQAAVVAANALNIARRGKGRPARLSDYLIEWKGTGQSDRTVDSEAMGRALAERLGGTWTDARG
jgi:hypothetical protein